MRDRREELRELTREAGDIATGAGYIARAEVRLAVTEVREGIRATVRTTVLGGITLAFALTTFMWLPLPVVLGLAQVMDWWAAGLLTVALLLAVSALLAFFALRQMKGISLVPREALTRMKEDAKWLKQQLSKSPG
jgi:uncharacterized membrane protein YqjE